MRAGEREGNASHLDGLVEGVESDGADVQEVALGVHPCREVGTLGGAGAALALLEVEVVVHARRIVVQRRAALEVAAKTIRG